MLKGIEVLEEAIKLIEDRDKWTCGEEARDSNGVAVRARHPTAVKWDMVGALHKIHGWSESALKAQKILKEALIAEGKDDNTADFNDASQHSEVLDFMKKAAENYRNKTKVKKK